MGRILVFINPDSYLIKSGHAKNRTINGQCPICNIKAKKILTEHDVTIAVTMGEGDGACTCWGCDLTYDYVKINGDYRT